MRERMRRFGVGLLAGCAVFLAGCSQGVVGKWTASDTTPIETKDKVKKDLTINREIQFKEDKTFEEKVTAQGEQAGKPMTATGTYTAEGEKLSLQFKNITVDGKDVTNSAPTPIKQFLDVSGSYKSEGDTLSVILDQGGKTLLLNRAAQ